VGVQIERCDNWNLGAHRLTHRLQQVAFQIFRAGNIGSRRTVQCE
jgi:hypothetical protein